MSRLIDADAAMERLCKVIATSDIFGMGVGFGVSHAMDVIKQAPTIEAEPVRHGRWEHGYNNGQYGIWCSECRAGFAYSDNYEVIATSHNYCPNCGAKMDKEDV